MLRAVRLGPVGRERQVGARWGWEGGGGVAAARYQPPVLGLQMFARSNVTRTSQRTSGGGCFFLKEISGRLLTTAEANITEALKQGKEHKTTSPRAQAGSLGLANFACSLDFFRGIVFGMNIHVIL